MPSTTHDLYVTGLRNAHAMEIQARELMERQIERMDEYPDMKRMLTQHLDETKEQLRRLDQCLGAVGEESSMLKDAAQSMTANIMAISHTFAGDEVLKNTFANNAFENFEIAAYTSLIELGSQAGVPQSRDALTQSLNEEQRMADWVRDHIVDITRQFLGKQNESAGVVSQSVRQR